MVPLIWRKTIGHPLRALGIGLVAFLAAATLLVGALAYHDLRRIDHIQERTEHAAQLRYVTTELLTALIDRQAGGVSADSASIADLADEIATLRALQGEDNDITGANLETLQALLGREQPLPQGWLAEGLGLAQDIMGADLSAQERLLEQMHRDLMLEVELAIATFGGLVLVALILSWVVRRRILKPLADLRALFSGLADGSFKAVSIEGIDPILIPLFQNYNYLVHRLETLEEEHRLRASSLEDEVRSATQALLEQHRSLANAERLAAVGEMAAGVAHELRNPLAGISVALGNLRQDVSDADVVERLNMLVAEIERVVRLLENYLAPARHAPEPVRTVNVGALVTDLLSLLRYQVPAHVCLESRVPEGFDCVLPRDRIQQVMLNLVINSVQALGESPGRIAVSVFRNGERVRFSVLDDGPGFPPETLSNGIRPFVTQHEAGTGLGLAMVRRVVHDLGGELELKNVEPHGACITLSLPYKNG